MPQTRWNTQQIKQCEQLLGQAMLRDESSLASFSVDFGHLAASTPSVVFAPATLSELQTVLRYANEQGLPVTLRAKGLSQGGQTLAVAGGLVLSMANFHKVSEPEGDSVWVEANATWSDLLQKTLLQSRMPPVVPYNTHLSIAGSLSIGGVGSASFREGVAAAHVKALEVVTANGELQRVDSQSPLFHACLGGQGQFGVITRANIALRPCAAKVRTFILTYLDRELWFRDLTLFRASADYIETFCSPALQGGRLTAGGRKPFAQWLFVIHVSVAYEDDPPELASLGDAHPWKLAHCQDESVSSWLYRHDWRFDVMRQLGQWEQQHPWYECLVSEAVLQRELGSILESLPIFYANIVQVVPIANRLRDGFFMAPDEAMCYSIMVLNPGIHESLVPPCLAVIRALDERLLQAGGKRYAAGYLGADVGDEYWAAHFGSRYQAWLTQKNACDPKGVFRSLLHQDSLFDQREGDLS